MNLDGKYDGVAGLVPVIVVIVLAWVTKNWGKR
jgi:hypothetical protein